MLEPVIAQLAKTKPALTVLSQDDITFPKGVPEVIDDTGLENSYRLNIEIVPTLIAMANGKEVQRVVGWDRKAWQDLTGIQNLGAEFPATRPGCGSLSVEPGNLERLKIRFGETGLRANRVELAPLEDEIEACFERGWSDGLPVVPPTESRVLHMLQGTSREPDEIVGVIPPNQVPCSVEKVAINAVMAGCKPEYMPVVLAAVEAACIDAFCLHGLVATTYFSGPMIVVNGPVARAIGMNAGLNALGQGNRANGTIGRALQLVVRNVGGGKPGGVDRSTLGNPGKYTFCFAEDETGSPWQSLAVERGFDPTASTVTLFAGDGVQGIFDQQSRTPDSLSRSFAACLRSVAHPKVVMAADAFLIVSPEHARVFRDAGWSKARLKRELKGLLEAPAEELVRGAGGMAEGVPPHLAQGILPKFRPGGLNIVHAGGTAGMFSAIVGGWVASGQVGSQPVTKEIR
jgi:hypothetical protein